MKTSVSISLLDYGAEFFKNWKRFEVKLIKQNPNSLM